MAVIARQAPAQADAAGIGGDYVPLSTPGALLDTRSGIGGVTGARGPGSTTSIQVLGIGGVPMAEVGAVLVDVTAVSPSATTHISLRPDGAPANGVSALNVRAGDILSNSAAVQVGANGRISVYNSAGSTHVLIDVQGYFTSSMQPVGGGFVPVDYARLVDTRAGQGAIPAGATRTFTLTGGVIPAGASAAFVDFIVGSTERGWLAVYAEGGSGPRATVDFLAGTTSHGASVRLPANGRVTVANNSTEPIHLALTAQGYFTGTPSTGAGFRPSSTRLYVAPATPIPANGTIDVQVNGVNGLPTRGVAAAALNISAVRPTQNGNLQAWPADGAPASFSALSFSAGTPARSALAVTKVSADGKVRIRNASTGTVFIYVDLQGYFADPLPRVPIAQYARVTVHQLTPTGTATQGEVAYAYVGNYGEVMVGRQRNPNVFGSVEWTNLSEMATAFTGQPALAQLADGRVQLAVQHTDSNIRSISETAPSSPTWQGWNALGGSMASPPTTGKLADGTVVLFAVDADGHLWALNQRSPVPAWRNLGDAGLTGPVTVVVADGGLRLVGVGAGGAVQTAIYRASGSLSAWEDLGGSGMTGTPAVVVAPGYVTRVFVRGPDGVIRTKSQDIAGTFEAEWTAVGDLPAAGSPAAILDPLYGRIAVVVRGTDNYLHYIWENAQALGTWGSWQTLEASVMGSDPTVSRLTNDDGQQWMITARTINNTVRYFVRASPSEAGRAGLAGDAIGPTATPRFTAGSLPAPPAR
ncbi:MAG TPA: hypothetical protein VES42_04105 [Pilimelia sp.]|nr:hypothetical protein [Pilimelia sp.]